MKVIVQLMWRVDNMLHFESRHFEVPEGASLQSVGLASEGLPMILTFPLTVPELPGTNKS